MNQSLEKGMFSMLKIYCNENILSRAILGYLKKDRKFRKTCVFYALKNKFV